MAFPAPIQELWNVWREIEGSAGNPVMVNLLAPEGELADGLRELLLLHGNRPGTLRTLPLTGSAPPEADIHLVLLEANFGPTATQLAVLRKLDPSSLVLMMISDEESFYEPRRREVATSVGVRPDQILQAKSLAALAPLLAEKLLAQFPDHGVPLARQFPLLREEACKQEIHSTSQQNALVGAMPIPGADLPLMTANQMKMVLRMAAIYDQPMTADRLKEVLAVVGGGFALRSVARQVFKLIPGPGWMVSGAVGYGGTLAMGKAAQEYFRRATEPPAPPPKPERTEASRTVIDVDATPAES